VDFGHAVKLAQGDGMTCHSLLFTFNKLICMDIAGYAPGLPKRLVLVNLSLVCAYSGNSI